MKNECLVECWDNETEVKLLSFDETDLNLPITAVGCFLIKDDSMLLIKNSRGWDIPGGHIESGETPLDAIKRELKEEANCEADNFTIIGHLHCHQLKPSAKYPPDSLITIYSCHDFDVNSNALYAYETTEAKFVSLDEVGKLHHNWTDLKKKLLEQAVNSKK